LYGFEMASHFGLCVFVIVKCGVFRLWVWHNSLESNLDIAACQPENQHGFAVPKLEQWDVWLWRARPKKL
jgi:hypothetical protein